MRRIILSRELSLDEVAEIRQQCPDIELEVFVHGALCIAYSGRCLLWLLQPSRSRTRAPAPTPAAGTTRYRPPTAHRLAARRRTGAVRQPRPEILEEKHRPGELMPIEEDEHGTYIMNSKDLRAIEHVHRLIEIGVDSLKIEGRTKAPTTSPAPAQAYRQAIDDAVAGRPFDPTLLSNLENPRQPRLPTVFTSATTTPSTRTTSGLF